MRENEDEKRGGESLRRPRSRLQEGNSHHAARDARVSPPGSSRASKSSHPTAPGIAQSLKGAAETRPPPSPRDPALSRDPALPPAPPPALLFRIRVISSPSSRHLRPRQSPAFLPSLTHGGKGFPGCFPLGFPVAVLLPLRACCCRRRPPGSRRAAGSTSAPATFPRCSNMTAEPGTGFSTQTSLRSHSGRSDESARSKAERQNLSRLPHWRNLAGGRG